MRQCKNFTCAACRTRWPSGAADTPAASGTSAAAPWPPGGTAAPQSAAAAVLPSLAAALCLATAIADVEGETMKLLGFWSAHLGPCGSHVWLAARRPITHPH